MELNSKTIDELKVIAYDLLASKEQTERNLQIVNQTIAAKYEELKKAEDIKADMKSDIKPVGTKIIQDATIES
ncbi:MAG: hypothetical protein PX635_00660 [Nostocales cyanobacterium LE14-WE12]|jgi:hypothetical protein|nr:hypothetical protein [Nostocales cyanobacterium LE14-WE12]